MEGVSVQVSLMELNLHGSFWSRSTAFRLHLCREHLAGGPEQNARRASMIWAIVGIFAVLAAF
jgi:hypothetical protein